jgi:hypothetical protein
MKRFIKILHTLGSIGLMGGYGAYAVMVYTAPTDPAAYAVVRYSIERVSTWLVLPSLCVCLVSGLLAIAAHPPFIDATWVWVKAFTGVAMFEGTLGAIQGRAKEMAEQAAKAATGTGTPEAMAELLRGERTALWLLIVVAGVNVVVGVWRPRFKFSSRTSGSSTSERQPEAEDDGSTAVSGGAPSEAVAPAEATGAGERVATSADDGVPTGAREPVAAAARTEAPTVVSEPAATAGGPGTAAAVTAADEASTVTSEPVATAVPVAPVMTTEPLAVADRDEAPTVAREPVLAAAGEQAPPSARATAAGGSEKASTGSSEGAASAPAGEAAI